MFKKIVITIIAIFGYSSTINAQLDLAHEVGVIFGPVTLQSDFGERHNIDTNVGNTGFGIGVVHFINFSSNSSRNTYFAEHFKVRSELSFNKANLEHFGQWVERESNSAGVAKLKAMTGSSTLVNLGSQLEYSPFVEIKDFERLNGRLSPYVSLGFLATLYKSKVSSSLGPLGTPETTPGKYLVPSDGHQYGFASGKGIAISAVGGLGVHYKLDQMNDLMFETRFQVFSSDWIDGLNPNKDIYTENKANDWQVWFNVGYIYYLEY
jgi:hypothetical protein